MSKSRLHKIIILSFGVVLIVAILIYLGLVIRQGIKDERLRAENQKTIETIWNKEDEALPNLLLTDWYAEVLNHETDLKTMEWKELAWEKGDVTQKRKIRLILYFSEQVFIGELPSYTMNNDYEMSALRRGVDNNLVHSTNPEREELDLPRIATRDSKTTIVLSERNKVLNWLMKNPLSLVSLMILAPIAFCFYKLSSMYTSSYNSRSTFRRYKPDKKGRKTVEDIGGFPEAKAAIEKFRDIARYPNITQAFGGRMPPGILISGPYGTGKTLLGKVFANIAYDLGFSVYQVQTSMLLDLAPAAAARKISDGFKRARKDKRALIIFDQGDTFGRTGIETQSFQAEEKSDALTQLLVEIQGIETGESSSIVVVFISNKPEFIDRALLRSGRVGLHIKLHELKTEEARKEVLSIHGENKRIPKEKKNEWFDAIAKSTYNFTGADLKELLDRAANFAAALCIEQCEKHNKPDAAESIPESANIGLDHLLLAQDDIKKQKRPHD